MILNVRGCSGSGKSFPGFKLLEEFGPPIEEIRSTDYFPNRRTGAPRKKPKLIAQILPGGLCLAGRYTLGTSTRLGKGTEGYSGGVDGFFPVAELEVMLGDLARQYPHMYVESLMISGTYQRWLDFSRSVDHDFVFATLDTPIDLCLQRVQDRNGGAKVNERAIIKHDGAVKRCAKKFAAADGVRACWLDHEHSYEQVRGLLLDGGWEPVGSTREEVPQGH